MVNGGDHEFDSYALLDANTNHPAEPPAVVSEPSTILLLGSGLVIIGALGLRRKGSII
jgi:hypothetical protein